MNAYSKGIIVSVIGIAILAFGGNYFYKCVNFNPLFFNLNKSSWPHYETGERVRFCWNMLFQPRVPKEPDRSVAVPILGTMSAFTIELGTEHPPYNSSPPTSGWNYDIGSGTKYTKNKPFESNPKLELKGEAAVARLYRGRVWISFQRQDEISDAVIARWRKDNIPEDEIERRREYARTHGVSEEVIDQLKKIAQSTPLVFVSSRTVNGYADISLNALGRQDKFSLENGELTDELLTRIWDFILRYRNQPPPNFLEGSDE